MSRMAPGLRTDILVIEITSLPLSVMYVGGREPDAQALMRPHDHKGAASRDCLRSGKTLRFRVRFNGR